MLIEQTPALVRGFYDRLGRLRLAPDSEYYAPQVKEQARLAKEKEDALKASPDFDEELYRLEQFEAAEKARKANPLEFYGYTPTDRRLDDLADAIGLLRFNARQHWAGDRHDELPPFRFVHRPGREIKHPDADDPRYTDDFDEVFGASE
ncbi:hypothetical protein [Pseudarthrobacter equi]|uniref:hypothetical protein n=1 Tax=Pseudarthrobacter equi TaxID=728066 RepID=UPI0012FDEEC1|nr:hypothetical protein [Pseudarthrobacter equi]